MPVTKLVNAKLVSVFAALMATEFHELSAAPVMLASLVTLTLVLTKYAVPVSVLWTVALLVLANVAVVTLAVGAVLSIVQLLVVLATVDTLPAESLCRTCTAPVA